MLDPKTNARLTRVGKGEPAGELLRRYWHPVAVAKDLVKKPQKRVQVMGEHLVLFRLASGAYGCLAESCSHRGCSLYYGFVEAEGLRCPYHGWKYGLDGRCLEQPFEPKESSFKDRIRQTAYPVQELGGLLFLYMGPDPAPLLPRWDVLVRTDGQRKIQLQPILQCNWLQAQENSVDTVHTYYLHGHSMKVRDLPGADYYYRPLVSYEYVPFEWGVIKRRTYAGDQVEAEVGHPAIFPNILRSPEGAWQAMHWRVPIDDTHTQIFWVGFREGEPSEEVLVESADHLTDADGEYLMDSFFSQDKMAWETEGPIFNRSGEHLGVEDEGVILWRKLLEEQIRIVENGGDPMALVRDPAQNTVIRFSVSGGQARQEYGEIRHH